MIGIQLMISANGLWNYHNGMLIIYDSKAIKFQK